MYCRWFAACENQAIGLAEHPVLTAVPICARCAKSLGIKVPILTCAICGADIIPVGAGIPFSVCSEDCYAVARADFNNPIHRQLIGKILTQTAYETRN